MEYSAVGHLDYETYSEVDLTKVGLVNYVNHPSTRIELASWAIDHGDVKTWDVWETPEPPEELCELLRDPSVFWKAFNAPFEKTVTEALWGIEVPYTRWECVMIHSYMLGFSGTLGMVGEQIGLPFDKQKLKNGRELVLKFCKPAGKNRKADRYGPWNAPDEWAEYRNVYSPMDVVSERELDAVLAPYPIPPRERDLWLLDRRINERGLPIDMDLVNAAITVNDRAMHDMKQEMNRVTGLANANSVQQLRPWCKYHGVDMPNMQAATVDRYLNKPLPDNVRTVLEMRRQVSQTSTAKFKAVALATHDGRCHNVFQFAGAQRTQRWAGRIIQPHNLKRGYEDADERAEVLLQTIDPAIIKLFEGNVIDFLSNIIRTQITAPAGRKLVVNDYGSIESRFLGWMSNCSRINNCFAAGRDTYREFAVEYYGVEYNDVTKEQRTFSKPPVLGCGYQLGPDTLIDYGKNMGVSIPKEESGRLVELWRALHPEVVDMWGWLIETCKRVTQDYQPRQGYGCVFYRDQNYLFIYLPSRRYIAYHLPAVVPRVPPWEVKKQKEKAAEGIAYTPRTIPTLTYMGMNQYTNKWERISTHGGKITENIIQALARDLLRDHMLELEALGLDEIGHVHDELIIESSDVCAEDELYMMQNIMSETPEWAPGLLLSSDGFITQRYKKA